MERVTQIQISKDTWIIMREWRYHPKAVIRRVTDTNGTARFMVYTWQPHVADRRLVSIHDTFEAADAAVPFPGGNPITPPHPGASPTQIREWEKAKAQEDERSRIWHIDAESFK